MSATVCCSDRRLSIYNDTPIECTILDVLNVQDCWNIIFSYVPIKDIIRSERVSKRWSCVVNEYLSGYRTFKTSWWPDVTKDMLNLLFIRLGASLKQLHIDDRINPNLKMQDPHRFCDENDILPNLEVLIYHYNDCNYLKYLFQRCPKLKSISLSLSDLKSYHIAFITDNFIYDNIGGSSVESLTLINDAVNGSFLAGNKSYQKLKYLDFSYCMGLDRFYLKRIEQLRNLSTLKIDHCPMSLWESIPHILSCLSQLQVLSLSDYYSYSYYAKNFKAYDFKLNIEQQFCRAVSRLSSLKHLNLSNNSFVTNELIRQLPQTCKALESLDVSRCNEGTERVDDAGVLAVCEACEELRELNVSHLKLSRACMTRLERLVSLGRLTVKYTS